MKRCILKGCLKMAKFILNKKTNNEIIELNVFSGPTLKMLLSRVNRINDLLNQVISFRKIDIKLINSMQGCGIDIFHFPITHTQLAFVLYRSLFQEANWEERCRGHKIRPKAYGFDTNDFKIHSQIQGYANQVLCHQNIETSVKRGTRALYPDEYVKEDGSAFSIVHGTIDHIDILEPLLNKMRDKISEVYLEVFKQPITDVNAS